MLSASRLIAASKVPVRSISTSVRILVATLSTMRFLGSSMTFLDLTRVLLEDFFSWETGRSMRSSSSSSFRNYQLR